MHLTKKKLKLAIEKELQNVLNEAKSKTGHAPRKAAQPQKRKRRRPEEPGDPRDPTETALDKRYQKDKGYTSTATDEQAAKESAEVAAEREREKDSEEQQQEALKRIVQEELEAMLQVANTASK